MTKVGGDAADGGSKQKSEDAVDEESRGEREQRRKSGDARKGWDGWEKGQRNQMRKDRGMRQPGEASLGYTHTTSIYNSGLIIRAGCRDQVAYSYKYA